MSGDRYCGCECARRMIRTAPSRTSAPVMSESDDGSGTTLAIAVTSKAIDCGGPRTARGLARRIPRTAGWDRLTRGRRTRRGIRARDVRWRHTHRCSDRPASVHDNRRLRVAATPELMFSVNGISILVRDRRNGITNRSISIPPVSPTSAEFRMTYRPAGRAAEYFMLMRFNSGRKPDKCLRVEQLHAAHAAVIVA